MQIEQELIKNFNSGAEEINLHRAFPYGASGLKPVAGHILWSMYKNKRTSNKPYTKSAKCSGEVMSFSPHGEAYGSMVRLAQDFTYHIPYIDGHGSFGSAIGGPTAAASRYTEMRLSNFIEDVLFYNTELLDMGLNYLEEEPEPILDTWVALLPLLFMTNTSGMGYTCSNTWSSLNLVEFKEQLHNYINTGKIDYTQIYPDFPTGGVIANKSEMAELLRTGKGTIRLRGEVEIINDTINILSLPYQTYPEQFVEDVKKYVNSNTTTIVDVANRCGKNGFLIEVECEPGTAEYMLNQLYKKTCLQVNISDEHKAILNSSIPTLVTLEQYMKFFIDSNIKLVTKEAKLNLDKIEARLEIVNGLLSALDIIDEIIENIKKSKSKDDAKKWLIKRGFTENQAQSIVDMQLGRLANLEQIKLRDEKKALEKDKATNTKLLTDNKEQIRFFLNRFDRLVDKYGWERKTKLIDAIDMPVATDKPAKLKPSKEWAIVLTSENTLKRIDIAKFKQTDEDEKMLKISGNQKITMISNAGKMYKVYSNKIDKCLPTAAGTNISEIRPEIGDEHIVKIYSEDVTLPYIYFITKNGLGKMCEVQSTLNLSKSSGTIVCGFKSDDDEVIDIKLLDKNQSFEITTNKRVENITPDRVYGRGAAGKKIIYLGADEKIIV